MIFAVILYDCGTLVGSGIQESVMTLQSIDRSCDEYQIIAPDYWQYFVVNHVTVQNGVCFDHVHKVFISCYILPEPAPTPIRPRNFAYRELYYLQAYLDWNPNVNFDSMVDLTNRCRHSLLPLPALTANS